MERIRRCAVVVDELALVRLGLASLLGSMEIDVVAEAPGGREGAEQSRLHGPSLVVIGAPADMPVLEAVRRARATLDTVAILALLGVGQLGSVADVVEAGADGVALRGALPREIAEALAVVSAGRRYVASSLSSGLVGRLASAPAAVGDTARDLLTYREREVLALIAGGASNKEIAANLSVTVATVKSHLVHVYAKLEARNRQEALSRAVGLGLLA
ncbi:MAG TPA: response regulator transcription factor [Acidimicrobiia bacterium]